MNKKLLTLLIIITISGIITNCSVIITGGLHLFVFGVFLLSIVPYLIYITLSYWFKSFWISLITGISILSFDIYLHLMVFVFPQDAQDAIALIFSPLIMSFLTIIIFISLTVIRTVYRSIKRKKLDIQFNWDFSKRSLLINFALPAIIIPLVGLIGYSLLTSPSWMEDPLHKAITYGDFDRVKKLVESGADIEVLNYSKQTPLEACTGLNRGDMIRYLISKGANLNNINPELNMTPLMWSAFMGTDKSAKALIAAGADLNIQNNEGDTALHYAVNWIHPEVCKLLINAGANVNIQNKQGETPLHCAAKKGFYDVVEIVLSARPDLEARDKSGFTPLHWAASYGYLDVIEQLLDAGADINVKNNNQLTPEEQAKRNNHQKAAQLLESVQLK